jgi:hypothetical protein
MSHPDKLNLDLDKKNLLNILNPYILGAINSPILMEQLVFRMSLIIEDTTDKLSHFLLSMKSIYNKNVCVQQTKYIVENCTKVKTIK